MAHQFVRLRTAARHRLHGLARPRAGFTLIELLVVSAIFVILSTVVLANHARFGSHIILQNLAHDIALSIRQAQVFGISTQRFGDSNFDVGYGMYFQITSPNQYVMFADAISGNGLYNDGETVRATSIAGGFQVYDLCVTPLGGAQENCDVNRLDILFIRPEPDAFIRVNGGATLYGKARIVIRANNGNSANVNVGATGQIYVD